jgi:endonuclease/exonuclease/phosphatase family metal-dependent hydrolase
MDSLRILTLNVGLLEIDLPLLRNITLIKGKSVRIQAIIHILRQHAHDVILLQEVGLAAQRQLIENLKNEFPYHATHHARKLFSSNLLILSKIPLSNTTFVPYTSQTYFESWGIQKGMLYATVNWNQTGYHIINTHLVSSGTEQRDTSSSALRVRNDQINQIKSYIEKMFEPDDHVIIGGDFNMGPQTSTENYQNILGAFKDCMEHVHEHNRITWSPTNPLARNRVIHDPAKQIDGFYMRHEHYDAIANHIEINRMFLDEISFEHNSKAVSTMISDHYGVEMIIKKTA